MCYTARSFKTLDQFWATLKGQFSCVLPRYSDHVDIQIGCNTLRKNKNKNWQQENKTVF